MKEIELKLKLTSTQVTDLFALKFIQEAKEGPVTLTLENTYFDTVDFDLSTQGLALRIRKQGGQLIQTLKDAGCVSNGLHQRNEWEAELSCFELDLALLPVEASEQIKVLNKSLQPVFQVDFERTLWNLTLPEESLIELAFDRGFVKAGGKYEPVCEIELELKQGSKQMLFKLASELQEQLMVEPFDQSKAQRGYCLAGFRR